MIARYFTDYASQDMYLKLWRSLSLHVPPRTHEPMFQETVRQAGLNKYLFEMVSIREQYSWVYMKQKREATDKVKDLVRMAVANARLIKSLEEVGLPVTHKTLVIGGGVCPVARCAKSLFNGPCGRSSGGKCAVNKETDCAWQLIIDRLKAIGQLEKYEELIQEKDWSISRDGGPCPRI